MANRKKKQWKQQHKLKIMSERATTEHTKKKEQSASEIMTLYLNRSV